MARKTNYIESPQHWKTMYANPTYDGIWKPVDKVPIENIKVDKSMMDFANDISHSSIIHMLTFFNQEAWEPIIVNENFYLLDGQHRLAVAKQMCLKYIDVIVQTKSLF